MSSVAKRILTGSALVLLVLVLLRWNRSHPNGDVVWGVGLVLSGLAAYELGRMPGLSIPRLGPALMVAVIAVTALSWFRRGELTSSAHPYAILLAGAALAAPIAGVLVGARRLQGVGLALWAAVPLFGLLSIHQVYGERGLACLVVLSKVGDIFGYFVGRSIGKRHPFPNLSPGKTVAGCVASLVAGTAAGVLLAATGALPDGSTALVAGGVAGLLLNLASQAGDLLESRVKRLGGVKDSSGLVGPAGGVLDVVDSLLLSIPVALLLWPVLFGIAE